ncbi:substrate-binding domain-containing protein [Labrys sp. La1]|uniref:substrate-binding domain-containing protein n=1 Tax=Labrys sp. La1 TaxID=3404917 RepID=UPI003EB93C3C
MTDTFSRRQIVTLLGGLGLAGMSSTAFSAPNPKPKPKPDPTPVLPAAEGRLRIGVIVPVKDDPFYKACADGAQEAATQIGNLDMAVAAPEKRQVREQALFINGFVKQKVDAILISPVDAGLLAPLCKRAMIRGIKVVSFEQALPANSRMAHVDPVSNRGKAESFLAMLADDAKDGGDIAILAGGRNGADGQGLVSETMQQWLKPAYGKLKLADTLYGNDDEKAGYAAADFVLRQRPNLKGLLVFSPAALVGAAQCVTDRGLAGKVFVTGFGRPATLKAAMSAKAVECFATANPVDIGYAAMQIAAALARNTMAPGTGSMLTAGRLGQIALGENSVATLRPFVVDAKNFDKYADLY